jgi:hypothetical protein
MSDPTYSPPTTGPYDNGSTQMSGGGSTTDTVSTEGRRVAGDAAESSKQVGRVAKDEAASVAHEAKSQARSLVSQASSQLSDQAASQKDTLVSWLQSMADELRSMVEGAQSQSSEGSESSQPGYARDLVERGADYAHRTASWLEDRQPNEVFQEVGKFARRRPGAFLLIAATAGVVVGRLTKGLTAAASDDSGPSQSSQFGSTGGYGTTGYGYPATTGYAAPATTGYATGTTGYAGVSGTGLRQDPLGVAGEADVVVPASGTRPGMESQRHDIGTTSLPSTTPSSVEAGGYAEDGR